MKESQLQAKILKDMAVRGIWAVKTIAMNRAGVMDIIGCTDGGRFIGIEVKLLKGKLSKLQEVMLDRVNSRGGIAMVVYGWDDYVEKINAAVPPLN